MSQPEGAIRAKPNASLLIRGAIWIAIGALIAAAFVCVIWVLVGDQDGLIARAFLTILLLAAFAGIAILESGLAPERPDWVALASMITWIIALLVGAVKIWWPDDSVYFSSGAERFFQLLLVVGILQLALLHVRVFTAAAQRYNTVLTRGIYYLTLVFLVFLVGMLVFYLTFPGAFVYADLYWRLVVALAILAAVGTTLIPLLNALFAPKPKKMPAAAAPWPASAPNLAPWPTSPDGRPLPVLPDGSPDWRAYGPPPAAGHLVASGYGGNQATSSVAPEATPSVAPRATPSADMSEPSAFPPPPPPASPRS